MAKAKRMTEREKRERAKIKKELIEKGIIPPDKKRLNRKKFIDETVAEFDEVSSHSLVWDIYLKEVVAVMTTHTDKHYKVSEQAVGAAKVLKIAMRMKEFDDKLKSEGRLKYKVSEKYDYIKDIINL